MDLGGRGNDIAKQRFGAFDVDGEIVIDEEDGHLAFFAAGALLQPEQFTNHALISTEANRVSEKSGHRAELAPVGTRSEERRVGKECRSRGWPYQAEDGIRDWSVTGVQTCALPISIWCV